MNAIGFATKAWLLAGASWAALACWQPSPASAADLQAGTEQQLRDAITAANASPDGSSTITLTGSFVVSSTALPTANKALTIITDGFTLSGTGGSGAQISLPIGATATLTIQGSVTGGQPAGSGQGGTGLNITGPVGGSAMIVNSGTITGGAATGPTGTNTPGGIGIGVTNATLVNNGAIIGGATPGYTGTNSNPGVGVSLASGGSLVNNANATILGGSSLGAGAGAGVFMATGSGTLTNNGTIRGGSDLNGVEQGTAAIQTRLGTYSITNAGTLEGGTRAAAYLATSLTSSATIVNSGTIRAGAGGTVAIQFSTSGTSTLELQTGSLITGTVVAGSGASDTLRLTGAGTTILDGGIGASAQYRGFDIIQKTGTGTWILTGESAIASTFQLQQGTLQIGNGGTTGSLAGNIANAGTLVFNRSDTLIHAGAITGTGAVNQTGPGTTILTGNNTYTGATTVSAGTLQLANGGRITATSGTTVASGAALTVTGAGSAFTSRNFTLGSSSGGAVALNVLDGGQAFLGATGLGTVIGVSGVSDSNPLRMTVNVSGSGSLLQIPQQLTFANPGNNIGAINVTGGGQVVTDILVAGPASGLGVGGAFLVISGAGSSWTNTSGTTLRNGSISILDGGRFVTSTASIGLGATMGSLTVSGAGSTFTANGLTVAASGNGVVTIANGGRVVANGVVTMGGPIGSGVLNIGGAEGETATAAGVLQAASVNLRAGLGSRINFNHTDAAYVFAPVISGNGAVNQTGPGTTILTSNNTYTGTTTISAGTLAITQDASLGNTAGTLAFDGGTLRFDAGFDLSASRPIGITAAGGAIDTNGFATTIAQGITGAGGLIVTGGGTLVLTGANTYAGGTAISAGTTLQLGAGGTSGSIQGDVLNNGTLTFNRSDSVSFAGTIAGSGALVVTGGGTVILTGNSSYTGGTTILAGTLQIGDGGTSGSIIGDIRNNSPHTLVFNRSDTLVYGGVISGIGAVRQEGSGTTILTGDSTYTGGTTITSGTLQLGAGGTSGSILGDVLNNGTLAFNRSDAVTFAGAISGTGAVRQDGSGVTVLAGANTYSGPTAVNAGTLQAGAAGAFSAASAATVAAGATLALAGFDQTIAGLTNAGLVTLGGAPGTTLTVAGNYVGQGGALALNTVLAGDGAASDRLVVSGGSATGSTGIRVTNLGGAGAQTVEGIRVVQVAGGGTTAAGAFRLDTRAVAGAYEYQLFRGGNASADDWYLRSFLLATPASPETPATPGSPGIPLYRPEVALYAPIGAIGRQMGLATLGSLHARRGEELEIAAPDALGKAGEGPASGAWARAFGERRRDRWDGPAEARATGNLIGIQAGFDILRTQPYAGGHRDVAGLYVAYADYNAPSISGFAIGQQQRVGRLLMSGPAVGAYWTHYGPSGWYVDAVFQANWFDVSARSDFGAGLETNGTGYAASLEAGYPIRFGANWQIEPQAQVIWQGVSVDRARDAFSTVDWEEGDAVTGRIGARLQYTGRDDRTVWQPYAKLNLWHAFSGTDRVSFGATPIANRFGDTALEVGAGITARVNQTTSFYAHADYRWSLDGGRARESTTQGTIGIRVTW